MHSPWGGKAAVRGLLKASVVGVQAWRRRGTIGVVDEERGHGRRGALAWGGGQRGAVLRHGAVDGMGWCSDSEGGGVGAGLK